MPLLLRNWMFLVLFFSVVPVFAQNDTLSRIGVALPCPRILGDTLSTVLAPEGFLRGQSSTVSQIELRFGAEVPAVAQSALRFAADVWASFLQSPIPIQVDVDWLEEAEPNLLASAGPATLIRDFIGARPGVWYPIALAEALSRRHLNEPSAADINIVVNSRANWYYGTDARPGSGKSDLVTVAMHELGHGLGFISSTDTIRGVELLIGYSGRFVVYDLFLQTGSGLDLTDPDIFPNPSPGLLLAVSTDQLFFEGPTVLDVNAGRPVKLYAPDVFDIGSSVSHLDERSFPAGTAHSLMTPFLARGEAVHQPGAIALAIMQDIGWPVRLSLSVEGAPDLGAEQLLVLGPNPARERIWVLSPKPTMALASASLYDMQGRLLRTLAARQLDEGILIEDLAAGTYLLKSSDGRTGRFVKLP